MKKNILPLLLTVAFAASTAQAATLFYEGFDYAVKGGTSPTDSLIDVSSWTQAAPNLDGGATYDYAPVISGSYTYTGLTASGNRSSTIGEYLDGSSGSPDTSAYQSLGSTFGTDSSTLWVGFLMGYDNGVTSNHGGLYFRNGTSNQFVIGDPNGTAWGIGQNIGSDGASSGIGNTSLTGTTINAGPNFFLAKISYGVGGADTLDLWLNPTIAGGEGGLGAVSATLDGDFTFDGLAFSSGTGGNYRLGIDEIRIGETFGDTFTTVAVPEPSSLALLAVAFGAVAMFCRRRA